MLGLDKNSISARNRDIRPITNRIGRVTRVHGLSGALKDGLGWACTGRSSPSLLAHRYPIPTDPVYIYYIFFYMLIKTCWMQRCCIIFYIYIPSIFTLPPSAITKNPSSRKAHSSSPSPPLFLTLLFQHSLHSNDSSINLVTLQVICLFPNSIRPRSNFLSHTLLFFFLNLSWPILNCQRIVVYHAFFVTDW